jgi:hypothetical protein
LNKSWEGSQLFLEDSDDDAKQSSINAAPTDMKRSVSSNPMGGTTAASSRTTNKKAIRGKTRVEQIQEQMKKKAAETQA